MKHSWKRPGATSEYNLLRYEVIERAYPRPASRTRWGGYELLGALTIYSQLLIEDSFNLVGVKLYFPETPAPAFYVLLAAGVLMMVLDRIPSTQALRGDC